MIHVLFNGAHVAHERDQTVVLQLGTARIVERVLEITRIESVLPRAHDRAEAVRIIQQQAESASASG